MSSSDTITINLLIITLLSGAAGAIIPLIVLPWLNHRRRLYDRRLQHSNSLILLELRLLDIDAALHDNKIAFSSLVEGAKHGRVMVALPMSLTLEDRFFQDFYVSELNEKLYSFIYDLRRINYDIENFNRIYRMLSDALMQQQIKDKDFAVQLNGLLSEQELLQDGFVQLQNNCIALLGYVRVRIQKDKTWLMRRRANIIQKSIKTVGEADVKAQVDKHLADIGANSKKTGNAPK
jgi:hypothetical protein